VVILESTSQDVFDTEDLYFHSGETLTITAAKYQDEADSLLQPQCGGKNTVYLRISEWEFTWVLYGTSNSE
jgi:hypothetical protein